MEWANPIQFWRPNAEQTYVGEEMSMKVGKTNHISC